LNILVTGSRDYKRLLLVEAVLYAFVTLKRIPGRQGEPAARLFVGDARGVDREAARVWKQERGTDPDIFRAKWIELGKGAGVIRNGEMLKAFQEAGGGLCFAFWDGKSRGTVDMMRKIIAAGMSVMLPEGFQKIDMQKGSGDLRMRYVPNQEELDKLLEQAEYRN
jgi:hypothetical protein